MIKLIHGDCTKAMSKLDKESIDVIISDPPYHLTSITQRFGKADSKEATTKNNDGSFSRLSKGFMGKTWDGGDIAFNTDMWKQAYNVLKNGGYMAVFGGTRTFHKMAVAIEEAGFEIIDVIAYTYGSGFPKALSIDNALDKKLGAEREVVGNKVKKSGDMRGGNYVKGGNYEDISLDITAPSSDIAKKYAGYKTALKPAFEPILICKKGNTKINNKIENKDYTPFIYTAKASKKDRNMNILGEQIKGELKQKVFNGKSNESSNEIKDVEARFTTQPTVNNHATVKPLSIIKEIMCLLEEDKPLKVLDMFAGSGTTGVAIEIYNKENNTQHNTVLVELEADHIDIIKKRCCIEEVENV